jgi:hypothetical protein
MSDLLERSLLERLLPPDAGIDEQRRPRPGKRFKALELPALRHDDGGGIEVRIYKVAVGDDETDILLFTDVYRLFVVLTAIDHTDWSALARRGTLESYAAREAGRLRSYLRGRAELVGPDERAFFRLTDVERRASIVVPQGPAEPSVRAKVEDAFAPHGISVIWLDRPPPNADDFPTWEQILNGG